MGVVVALILGLVQGLTEFLPISSSGHVLLVSKLLMQGEDAGAGFTAVIQIGTLLAVFVYFWKDLVTYFGAWWRSLFDKEVRGTAEAKLGWGIFWGSIPIIVIGKLGESFIDTTLRSNWVVVGALVFFGLLMGVSEIYGKKAKGIEEFTVKDGVIMGFWQCLALIPGSSRSGSTITGGLFGGFERATAARVSFLLSVPAVTASGLYKLVSERDTLLVSGALETGVATLMAFVSGYAAIAFLMKFLQSKSTWVFVIYRVVLGAVIAGLIFGGVMAG